MKLYKSEVIAIAAATGSALTVGTLFGIQAYAEGVSEPPEAVQKVASILGVTALERCMSVTEEQLSDARDTLLMETSADSFSIVNYADIAKVAEDLGFTVFRPDLVINEIYDMSDYDEIVARAQEYLQGFGVKLVVQDDYAARGDFVIDKLPESFEDNIDHVRHKFSEVIKAFGRLPVEFIEYSGVRHVVISGSIAKYNGEEYASPIEEAEGLSVSSDEAIYLDEKYFDSYTVWHEIAHFLDWKMCGTSDHSVDDAYASLNIAGYIYEGPAWDDEYNRSMFVSPYSESEIPEDKAEVMMNILNSNEQEPLRKCDKSCPIFDKFALLLARLDAEFPGIRYYLSQIDQEGVQ